MQCPSCGNEVRQDAKFCDACGHLLGQVSSRKSRPSVEPRAAPVQPKPRAAAQPVIKARSSPGKIQGVVRGFQSRTESQSFGQSQQTWTVWTFRLESYDEGGNLIQRIPVEMRGLSMEGSINEGDELKMLRPNEMYNYSTHSVVRAKGISSGQKACSVIALVIFFSFVALIIGIAVFGWSSFILPVFRQFCESWGSAPNPPPWCP